MCVSSWLEKCCSRGLESGLSAVAGGHRLAPSLSSEGMEAIPSLELADGAAISGKTEQKSSPALKEQEKHSGAK